MRIHAVRLRNLNSLYGEHTVDFVRDLRDAPLFLIVGPTGSGKSTLMDAIALALFGATPRLDGGRANDADARMVMSRGTGRCLAEVVFSKQAPGQRRRYYRAQWECWRARDQPDGALQTPRRSLEELGDPDGDESRTLVDDARAKFFQPVFDDVLEGMRPAEFQRSMLLAQGEFSAFLRASIEERAAILERLTNTERYRHIGARAKERWQRARDHMEQLRARVDAIQLLTAPELDALRERALQAETAVVEARTGATAAGARLEWARRLATLRRDDTTAAARRAETEAQWIALAPERERIAESDRCAAAAELVRRLNDARARLQSSGARFEEASASVPELRAAVEVAAEAQGTAVAALADTATRVAYFAGEPIDTAGDDRGVAVARHLLDTQREELTVRRAALSKAIEQGARLVADEARLTELARTVDEAVSESARAGAQADEAGTELAAATELRTAHQAALRAQELVLNLADRRAALADGDACPLCGSTHHPYVNEADHERRARAEAEVTRSALAESEARIAAAQNAHTGASQARSAADARAEAARRQLVEVRERIAQEKTTRDALLAGLDPGERADLEAALHAVENRLRDRGELAHALDAARDAAHAAAERLAASRARLDAALALVAERAERVQREQGEVAGLDAELASSLAELGVPDVETLAGAVLAPADRAALGAAITAAATARDRARGQADALASQLRAHLDARPDGLDTEAPNLDALESEAARAQATLHEAQERRATLAADLRHQEESRERRDALVEAFDAAESDVALWDEMRKLIGSNDGGTFQKFAQTLNLAELVDKANVRLRELAPRYSLVVARDAEGHPELAFAVEDHEHADRVRPQTTLSGGETFLVSLALALALADYRQTQMPIETLLLDEGFGTLDTETLDVAMSALERLCAAGGTQIGVISHVEALRERIDAQVVIEKLGGGRSRVRVRT